MAFGDFKDLNRRTTAHKVLHYKVFNIAKNPKNYGCQCELASMIYKFFDEKTFGGATTLANKSAIENEIISNKKLAEALHKPIIRKINNRKVQSPFIDNI